MFKTSCRRLTTALPKKGELWQHVKTGKQYRIQACGRLQSKREKLDMEECAIYSLVEESFSVPLIWIRPLEDFVDLQENNVPRFVKIE